MKEYSQKEKDEVMFLLGQLLGNATDIDIGCAEAALKDSSGPQFYTESAKLTINYARKVRQIFEKYGDQRIPFFRAINPGPN